MKTLGKATTPAKPWREISNRLQGENRDTFPKIQTGRVFKNAVALVPRAEKEEADQYFKNDRFTSLPKKSIDVTKIVPIQKNLTFRNLEAVKRATKETGAFLLEKKGLFYVLDGHHRIAINILKGRRRINAFVYKID